MLHGAQDEGASGLDASDDLDDDVGPGDELGGIRGEEARVDTEVGTVTSGPTDRDSDDLEWCSDAGGEVVGLLDEETSDSPAHDSGPEQGDAQRLLAHIIGHV
jgi:hypothetical protein